MDPTRTTKKYKLKKLYGLTPDDVEKMFLSQGGGCAICYEARPLCIDHNHKTGKVRALLCDRCNRGIGYFDDDPELIRGAAEYLIKHDGETEETDK